MYHELAVSGRELSRDFNGHVPYAVRQEEFQSQLDYLRAHNWRGINVTQALAESSTSPAVVITFDDGSETDLHVAAPLLAEAGFQATFYVIADWLGRPGYLSASQIRELQALNFEIGCHSMNHRYLTGLSNRELRVEIEDAKTRLEQVLARAVHHFSCPGGFWSQQVARIAAASGYRSVATSRIGLNDKFSDPYRLCRISIKRGMPPEAFASACRGDRLFWKQARERVAAIPKALLGTNLYVRLHAILHPSDEYAA